MERKFSCSGSDGARQGEWIGLEGGGRTREDGLGWLSGCEEDGGRQLLMEVSENCKRLGFYQIICG